MWFKVSDGFIRDEKVTAAARALGGSRHIGRVVAVWLEAGLFASEGLTDGFVPHLEVELFRTDAKPVEVMEACVVSRLFTKGDKDGEPGYQFHKWDAYQPSAVEVKEKRERDRLRKKSPGKPSGGPRGLLEESAWTIEGVVVESETIPRGILPESRALARARSRPVPSVNQDPKEPRALARRAKPIRMALELWEVTRHLHAATHSLIESGGKFVDAHGEPDHLELEAAIGVIAKGNLGADYDFSSEIRVIVDAVIGRRAARDKTRTLREARHHREFRYRRGSR